MKPDHLNQGFVSSVILNLPHVGGDHIRITHVTGLISLRPVVQE